MKADDSLLSQLHGIIADEFIKQIAGGEATPALLKEARQFLRDNGITCDGSRSPQMNNLMENMPDFDELDQQLGGLQ